MIAEGERAPDFEARTTDGRTLRLSRMRGCPVIVYFFPRAFTPGCTKEASQFRDAYPAIQELGAEVIGISVDDSRTQCDFASTLKLGFPLVADGDRAISRAWGVLWPLVGRSRRVTFVVDEEGVVRGVLRHEIRIERHRDGVLDVLRTLRGSWLRDG